MQITITRKEYYNSPDEVMHLIQYLGDFEPSETEGSLTLEFEDDPVALAKCKSNGYSEWAEKLVIDYMKSKDIESLPHQEPDTNTAISEELKKLNETIKAANGSEIPAPEPVKHSTPEYYASKVDLSYFTPTRNQRGIHPDFILAYVNDKDSGYQTTLRALRSLGHRIDYKTPGTWLFSRETWEAFRK